MGVNNSEKLPYVPLNLVAGIYPLLEVVILKWQKKKKKSNFQKRVRCLETLNVVVTIYSQASPMLHYTDFSTFIVQSNSSNALSNSFHFVSKTYLLSDT